MRCEWITLTYAPSQLKQALPLLRSAVQEDPAVLGLFTTEFGNINEVRILRTLHDAKEDVVPATCSDRLLAEGVKHHRRERFDLAPFSPVPSAGNYGGLYELREYLVRPGLLEQTLSTWREPFARRAAFSPAIALMSSATNDRVKLLHLWAYRDFVHRAEVRQIVAQSGYWPPPGGAQRWLEQTSIALIPDQVSPLH